MRGLTRGITLCKVVVITGGALLAGHGGVHQRPPRRIEDLPHQHVPRLRILGNVHSRFRPVVRRLSVRFDRSLGNIGIWIVSRRGRDVLLHGERLQRLELQTGASSVQQSALSRRWWWWGRQGV